MFFFGLLPSLGWGINSSLIGYSSKKIGPLATGLGAQFVGLGLTLALFLFFPQAVLPQHTWLALVFNGVMGALLFWGLCHIFSLAPVSVVTPIIASWTIIAAILGIVLLGDPFSTLKLAAILIVGVGIIFLTCDPKTLRRKRVEIITPGTGMAIFLAFGLGVNSFISAFVIKEIGWLSATVGIRIITVMVLGWILLLRRRSDVLVAVKAGYWPVWVIGLLDVVAFSSFNIAITSMNFSLAVILAALGPLVTIATSVSFFKERPTIVQALGAVMAVAGVVLFQV